MNKERGLWTKPFILILCVNFCHQMCQQMMSTLVPKFADSLGTSAYMVGLVSSVFAVAAFLIRPIASPAFDSFSRKKLLLAVLFGLFLTFVGYSFATNITAVLCVRFMHGVCMGCISPLSLAMAGDALPGSKMGKGIGIFTLCQAVGQAVGPSIGLKLSKFIGYKYTFLLGSAIILLGIVFAAMIKDDGKQTEKYRISLDKIIERDSIHPAIIMLTQMFAYTCIGSYLAIFAERLGVENIGLYFTVYAVCLVATRPICGSLIDKYGYLKVLTPGMLCFAASFFVIGSSKSINGFIAAAVINAFGYGVCYPTMQSLVINSAPHTKRGVAASTSFIGVDLGTFMGPFVAGLIVDGIYTRTDNQVLAYAASFKLMTVPIMIGLIYFWVTWKSIKANIDRYSDKEV